MEKIKALLSILRIGYEIDDKVRVKHGTLLVNNVVMFIAALIGFIKLFDCYLCSTIDLSNDQLVGISTGIVSMLAIINNVSTAATSSSASINPVTSVKILMNKEVKPIDPELAKQIRESNEK
jgi:hypothetical protein